MTAMQNGIIKNFSFEERELFYELSPAMQEKALSRLEQGEHSAYVFGKKYFFKNYFKITPDCLIPRPDTERVLERALSLIPKDESSVVADLCTGSGCIGISLLCERPNAFCMLCDISSGALEAAKENASLLGVTDRTKFILCDLMKDNPLADTKLDLIISNPPYLTSREIEEYPDLSAEPRIAFDGGEDGLDFYRRFVSAFQQISRMAEPSFSRSGTARAKG